MVLGIEKAYCLCLDKREEHWLDLKRQCESKNIEFCRFLVGEGKLFPKEEYDHIDSPVPIRLRNPSGWRYGGNPKVDAREMMIFKKTRHYNAFLSHKKMAKRALSEGCKKVLFLEDDAYFTKRFDDVVSKVVNHVEDLDYDMLYLGWWIGNEGDLFNEAIETAWKKNKEAGACKVGTIIEIDGNTRITSLIGGLHGVILRETILKLIAEKLEPTNPVDSQLNSNFFHHMIKSYFLVPKIIHDKGIMSHCEQSTTKRSKL